MKCVIVLLALVAVTYAQMGMHGGMGMESLMHAVHQEVLAIIQQNPGITLAECTSSCDELFQLLDPTDETHTDTACGLACQHEIGTTGVTQFR